MEIARAEQGRQWCPYPLPCPTAQPVFWADLLATFWKAYEVLEISHHDDQAHWNHRAWGLLRKLWSLWKKRSRRNIISSKTHFKTHMYLLLALFRRPPEGWIVLMSKTYGQVVKNNLQTIWPILINIKTNLQDLVWRVQIDGWYDN